MIQRKKHLNAWRYSTLIFTNLLLIMPIKIPNTIENATKHNVRLFNYYLTTYCNLWVTIIIDYTLQCCIIMHLRLSWDGYPFLAIIWCYTMDNFKRGLLVCFCYWPPNWTLYSKQGLKIAFSMAATSTGFRISSTTESSPVLKMFLVRPTDLYTRKA